jgi:hypothetical protein
VREMEKSEARGLSREELEAQHVELLPERIEMRRRRRHRIRQTCDTVGEGGGGAHCIAQRG